MDVTPLIKANTQVIQSYGRGVLKVSGQTYSSPVIVTPDKTTLWDSFTSFEDLDFSTFEKMLGGYNDVCLLGTGAATKFLKPELRKKLQGSGFNVEVMDTGAACRTYNVLMTEGRQIAALLFI